MNNWPYSGAHPPVVSHLTSTLDVNLVSVNDVMANFGQRVTVGVGVIVGVNVGVLVGDGVAVGVLVGVGDVVLVGVGVLVGVTSSTTTRVSSVGVLVGAGRGKRGTNKLCPALIRSLTRQLANFSCDTDAPVARPIENKVSPRRTI